MKRIAALLLSLLMLSAVCAFAEEEKIDLFTTESGTKVTLQMQGAYDIEFMQDNPGESVIARISRENLEDVYVVISPYDSDIAYSFADLTAEEQATIIDEIKAEYANYEELTVTTETTAAGNLYIKVVAKAEGVEVQERYTIFEGYHFDRMQFANGTELTDEDEAFLEEVQSGMWVEPAAAE